MPRDIYCEVQKLKNAKEVALLTCKFEPKNGKFRACPGVGDGHM